MKGIILNTGNETIYGSLNNGIFGVLISNKDGIYKLNFGGQDDDVTIYTWYKADLKLGDSFSLCYDEIVDVSSVIKIQKDKYVAEIDKLALDSYHKLKQELIEEGLI